MENRDDGGEDSREKFAADLRALNRAQGSLSQHALARRAGISHGSVNAALKGGPKVPSEYVVDRLIRFLAPNDLETWLRRRRRLEPAARKPASEQESASRKNPDAVPAIQVRERVNGQSWRRPVLTVLAGCVIGLFGGWSLFAAHNIGGLDLRAYCRAHYVADLASGDPVASDGTWAGWRCRLANGEADPVDFDQACLDQHPGWHGLWSSMYAHRISDESGGWRCFGAVLDIG